MLMVILVLVQASQVGDGFKIELNIYLKIIVKYLIKWAVTIILKQN
jgi:hypothetical protein